MTQTATATQPKLRRSSGWSPERRAKHAAAIRIWAPWAKSTGPRTLIGKKRSSMNAFKHGRSCNRRKDDATRFFKAALNKNSRFLRNLNEYISLKKSFPANELFKEMERILQKQGTEATAMLAAAFEIVQISDRLRYGAANDG
jgi:hypothetical protein